MRKRLPKWGEPLDALAVRQAVLLEPVEERLVRQIEEACGARAVAVRDVERLPQALPLVGLPRDPAGRKTEPAVARGARRERFREVLLAHDPALGEEHETLHHVRELAHVPRPAVLDEPP